MTTEIKQIRGNIYLTKLIGIIIKMCMLWGAKKYGLPNA